MMSKKAWSLLLFGLLAQAAWAQSNATQPAASGVAATQPAGSSPMRARVVGVIGNASYALVDAQGKSGDWRPAKVGDELPAGTQIRTRTRSRLELVFGDDTVAVIERATVASIDQFAKSGDTKRLKLGLGYGAIRAGVAETTLRSDMTIETPTATLSKRGTWDFRIEYEAVSGRFTVSLAAQGLVEMFNQNNGKAMSIGPGQYMTQAMMQWFDTAKFDRWVPIVDTFGMTDAEQTFNAMADSGIGVVEPGAGSTVITLSGHDASALAGQLAEQRANQQNLPLFTPSGIRIINRNEGNFGTGSGALPTLLGARAVKR